VCVNVCLVILSIFCQLYNVNRFDLLAIHSAIDHYVVLIAGCRTNSDIRLRSAVIFARWRYVDNTTTKSLISLPVHFPVQILYQFLTATWRIRLEICFLGRYFPSIQTVSDKIRPTCLLGVPDKAKLISAKLTKNRGDLITTTQVSQIQWRGRLKIPVTSVVRTDSGRVFQIADQQHTILSPQTWFSGLFGLAR